MNIFGRKKLKEDEYNSLLILKRILEKDKIQTSYLLESQGFKDLKQRIEDMDDKINGLHEKLEDLNTMFSQVYRVREDGVRKKKIKSIIKSLLEEHNKLTPVDLSKLINLSRTRCNEYLKEMEREGLAKGITVDRKRFYELVQK